MQTSSIGLRALCAGLLAALGATCFPLAGSGGAEPRRPSWSGSFARCRWKPGV